MTTKKQAQKTGVQEVKIHEAPIEIVYPVTSVDTLPKPEPPTAVKPLQKK